VLVFAILRENFPKSASLSLKLLKNNGNPKYNFQNIVKKKTKTYKILSPEFKPQTYESQWPACY